MLDARFAEAGFFHPAHAIGAGVVEAAGGFDEHVQAHQQAEGILRAVVVDDRFVDDERAAAGRARRPCATSIFFSSRSQSCRMWPIMTTSALGRGRVEKIARAKRDARRRGRWPPTYSSKMGADFGQIEADAGEVRIGERDLRR